VIKSATKGKAAEAAGLEAGDAFLQIDGKDVHSLLPGDITDLIINGQPGTTVDIVVDRHGQQVEKVVTRQAIENPPVVHDKDLGNGIAYIKIDDFGSSTESAQLAAAMDKYKDARAFVVDLRDNPCGLVDQVLASASLFVKDGTLMTVRQRHYSPPGNPVYDQQTISLSGNQLTTASTRSDNGARSVDTKVRLPYKVGDRPVVLLTNGQSASASEIFTGALHDTAHDTVVGTTTFGKGIGQSIVKGLPEDGYLRVTSLHYLTPSGLWPGPGTGPDINHPEYGLKPDKQIENPAGVKKGSPDDVQLNTAVDILKNKLQGN
jgi:carboxyl-terminal processing protease